MSVPARLQIDWRHARWSDVDTMATGLVPMTIGALSRVWAPVCAGRPAPSR
jgi:hypothetical protein